jgi:hypothetical protein
LKKKKEDFIANLGFREIRLQEDRDFIMAIGINLALILIVLEDLLACGRSATCKKLLRSRKSFLVTPDLFSLLKGFLRKFFLTTSFLTF